jgi:hypothetical protein
LETAVRRKAKSTRVQIRGKGWKKASSIAADKYELISGAILKSLSKSPTTFSKLVAKVKAKTPGFSGSVAWYTITCLRELEVRGKVIRHVAPVLYSRR